MAGTEQVSIVVIGGGIAGVSCAETLSSLCRGTEQITLVTASPLIKAVTNFRQVSERLEEFDIEERAGSSLEKECPNIRILQEPVSSIDSADRLIFTRTGRALRYDKLCICAGGTPKLIAKGNPNVVGIRDTESVAQFQKKLAGARRVLIVGNGGIATEMVYEIEGCEVIWAIKDKSISSTFVDAGAAEFFLPHLAGEKSSEEGPLKRLKYTVNTDTSGSEHKVEGGALGPDWCDGAILKGRSGSSKQVHVEYQCEIGEILTHEDVLRREIRVHETTDAPSCTDWPVYALLTNGKLFGCDFIVSATGVVPNGNSLSSEKGLFKLADDGGILVDDHMRTNVENVFAAGDVCSASWEIAPHWIQMRLWTQARQMGCYTAQCIVADLKDEPISLDICFELFAHMTKFFGYKVIMLGRFNGQGLDGKYDILLRMNKGVEYVKVILKDGRMQGAILIGETDLEETFENLILNQLDLTPYGEDLLDPGIDIEDYFD